MKTPDEIKKGMECCTRQENCDVCPYQACNAQLRGYDEPMCISRLLTDVHEYIRKLEYRCEYFADWIHDMAMEEPRWISVEERLPDNDIQYLTYTTARECVVCYYNGDGDWISDWASNDSPDVTHWMPLPEPPEEE